jgi:hypothetical protein
MAKRFIETGIFRKPLVRGLKSPYKAFFIYFITECDHAGVWDTTNLDIDSILLGDELTIDGIKEAFQGELVFIGSKVFMPGFVKYQYGLELNPENRVHKSVMARLNSIGIDTDTLAPYKTLTRPSQGCKDMVKDMDMVKAKDKDPMTDELKLIWKLAPKKSKERSSQVKLIKSWKLIKAESKPTIEVIEESLTAWNLSEKWKSGYAEGIHIWVNDHQWNNLPEPAANQPQQKPLFTSV